MWITNFKLLSQIKENVISNCNFCKFIFRQGRPLLLHASATNKKTSYATDHFTNLTQKTCREKATSWPRHRRDDIRMVFTKKLRRGVD